MIATLYASIPRSFLAESAIVVFLLHKYKVYEYVSSGNRKPVKIYGHFEIRGDQPGLACTPCCVCWRNPAFSTLKLGKQFDTCLQVYLGQLSWELEEQLRGLCSYTRRRSSNLRAASIQGESRPSPLFEYDDCNTIDQTEDIFQLSNLLSTVASDVERLGAESPSDILVFLAATARLKLL
jgi:hypothetical protein